MLVAPPLCIIAYAHHDPSLSHTQVSKLIGSENEARVVITMNGKVRSIYIRFFYLSHNPIGVALMDCFPVGLT